MCNCIVQSNFKITIISVKFDNGEAFWTFD